MRSSFVALTLAVFIAFLVASASAVNGPNCPSIAFSQNIGTTVVARQRVNANGTACEQCFNVQTTCSETDWRTNANYNFSDTPPECPFYRITAYYNNNVSCADKDWVSLSVSCSPTASTQDTQYVFNDRCEKFVQYMNSKSLEVEGAAGLQTFATIGSTGSCASLRYLQVRNPQMDLLGTSAYVMFQKPLGPRCVQCLTNGAKCYFQDVCNSQYIRSLGNYTCVNSFPCYNEILLVLSFANTSNCLGSDTYGGMMTCLNGQYGPMARAQFQTTCNRPANWTELACNNPGGCDQDMSGLGSDFMFEYKFFGSTNEMASYLSSSSSFNTNGWVPDAASSLTFALATLLVALLISLLA